MSNCNFCIDNLNQGCGCGSATGFELQPLPKVEFDFAAKTIGSNWSNGFGGRMLLSQGMNTEKHQKIRYRWFH